MEITAVAERHVQPTRSAEDRFLALSPVHRPDLEDRLQVEGCHMWAVSGMLTEGRIPDVVPRNPRRRESALPDTPCSATRARNPFFLRSRNRRPDAAALRGRRRRLFHNLSPPRFAPACQICKERLEHVHGYPRSL
jgi:hypothetical protein